ncbi:MAG: thioredoxin domain-containing protein [Leptospirales bacterium]|nr:thioredoxin domain-containing protein [Leptospirales bacterium]
MSPSGHPPNRLAREKSPYLLQHAHNPVDWFAWGEEAFSAARTGDKPILLSIGYATCHWCHVMERESFENEATAKFLNEHFISIKVDREERPDVDQIYMKALHATGQHGGWPLNMFLTTDLKPITGGTYFPPQPAYGRPSFLQVLETISNLWKTDRSKLLESADSLASVLGPSQAEPGNIPGVSSFEKVIQHAKHSFDEIRGGFVTNGPNKFPPSMNMLFLLQQFDHSKDPELLAMVETTCDAMKRGGIYDQIGGGLCRYSTDHDWLVPHFEKMLYDNALFARTLVELFRITGKERYKLWACDIFNYIERDMTSPEGAFYSAEDADSEGEEGKFYVWKSQEIDDELKLHGIDLEDRKRIARFWGLSARGNFENHCILHEPTTREEFLRGAGLEADVWDKTLLRIRELLLAKRSIRIRPLRDDKVLTSWNALMISGLARAGFVFNDSQLIDRARRAANFLLKHLLTEKGLLRRYRDGEARFDATLHDYASLGLAFVDLYQATFETEWLLRSENLAKEILTRFAAEEGGFFDTMANSKDLIVRTSDVYDGVEPSGNSATIVLLLMLAGYGFTEFHSVAEKSIRRFAETLETNGPAHSFMLLGLDLFHRPPSEVALLAGNDTETRRLLDRLRHEGPMFGIFAGSKTDAAVPLLAGRPAISEKSTFYVCKNMACAYPVHTADEAMQLISQTAS